MSTQQKKKKKKQFETLHSHRSCSAAHRDDRPDCRQMLRRQEKPDADSTSGESSSQSLEAADIDPLTGLSGFKAQGKCPIAIVVNNSKPARPQWGLCTPDIVFEGVTEAGITRMLWLYSDINKIPDKVGSLRSARHDFVEIAEDLTQYSSTGAAANTPIRQ